MNNTKYMSDQIEKKLSRFYQTHGPDPAFLARLRSNLLAPATDTARRRPIFSNNSTLRTWRYAMAVALLLIFGTIAVIGPARVWAQIEHWLGYAPGLGMVELSGSRVLEEPVIHSEGEISFRVDQFVASPSETLIRIHITGLPVDELPSSESIYVQWDDPNGLRKGLPMMTAMVASTFPPCPSAECRDIQPDGYDLFLAYGSLPTDINQVQIEWLTYGMVPDAAPKDFWTLDIPLIKMSNLNTSYFIQPGYSPLSAEDTQHGIKITVDHVFSAVSQTVIDTSISVLDPASWPMPRKVSLSTDTGDLSEASYFLNDFDLNPYMPIKKVPPAVFGAPIVTVWPARWRFSPIDIQASQMTLTIESVNFTYETQYQFEIETGQDPEVGTSIPLDISFDVAGYPLHIYQAQIVMAPAVIQGIIKDVKSIEFLADNTLSPDGKRLGSILFCPYDSQVIAESSIETQVVDCGQCLVLEPDMIKNGIFRVAIDSVNLEQQGPWVISWDVPQEVQ